VSLGCEISTSWFVRTALSSSGGSDVGSVLTGTGSPRAALAGNRWPRAFPVKNGAAGLMWGVACEARRFVWPKECCLGIKKSRVALGDSGLWIGLCARLVTTLTSVSLVCNHLGVGDEEGCVGGA